MTYDYSDYQSSHVPRGIRQQSQEPQRNNFEHLLLQGRFRNKIENYNPITGDKRDEYKNVQKRHYSNDYSTISIGRATDRYHGEYIQ